MPIFGVSLFVLNNPLNLFQCTYKTFFLLSINVVLKRQEIKVLVKNSASGRMADCVCDTLMKDAFYSSREDKADPSVTRQDSFFESR